MAKSAKKGAAGPLIVAIENTKGGNMKSTACVHLSIALSESKFRVLMVDLDEQGSLTRFMQAHLVNPARADDGRDVYHFIRGDIRLDEAVRATAWGDLLSASPSIPRLRIELIEDFRIGNRLRDGLKAAPYDFVLIDTPGRVGLECDMATNAARAIIYTMAPADSSLESLPYVNELIHRAGNSREVYGFPIGFGRSETDQELLRGVEALFPGRLLPVVPVDQAVKIRTENLRVPLSRGSRSHSVFASVALEVQKWR